MMSGLTRVMKFGGTSVGTADALRQVARILRQHTCNGDRAVAVVSAMSGVTTQLLRGATAAANGDGDVHSAVVTETLVRYDEMLRRLIVDSAERKRLRTAAAHILADYSTVCSSVQVLREATPRALDRALSCGEPLVVLLLASLLRQLGTDARSIEATDVVVTDGVFQNAVPNIKATEHRSKRHLLPLLATRGVVPIIAGFIGMTEDGQTTTLGRGGSDFSAAVLGNALDADEVW
ncbi:aspartate kinase, partial [Candidatus Bipolaricaulota bacterium]|nr:aspartate kinase [Candidatus Bipolaricaulota bacterium]